MSRATTSSPPVAPAALLRRLAALIALVVLLVAVPLLVVRLIGMPGRETLSIDALSRLDEQTIVHLGAAVFVVLWGWFATTAIAEAVVVAHWRLERRRPDREVEPLPPLEATPSGLVRKLVRLALVSATVLGTSAGHQLGGAAYAAGAPIETVVDSDSATASLAATVEDIPIVFVDQHGRAVAPLPVDARVAALGPDEHFLADGRATPYSLAVRLGDAALRERIIAANRGRPTPDGGTWSGGLFPEGMTVIVPRGLHDDLTGAPSWRTHEVRPGDSVHAIAFEVCGGDPALLGATVEAILTRNLGRTMGDGRLFRDPSLIRPGWYLEVPIIDRGTDRPITDGAPALDPGTVLPSGSPTGMPTVMPTGAAHHVVEPGSSYWSIAEDLLDDADPSATPSPVEILAATEALRDLNAPLLGRDDPNLIHPGDVLLLPGAQATPPTDDQLAMDELHDSRPTPPADEISELDAPPVDTVPPVDTPPVVDTAPVADIAPPVDTAPPAFVDPPSTTIDPGLADPTDADEAPASRPPLTTSLGAALLLCAGALGLIEARRRHQLRSAPSHAVVVAPTVEAVTTERLLRSLDSIQRAARLDLMLRCLGRHLVGSGHHVVAVLTGDDGTIDAVLDAPSSLIPPPPFRRVDARRWSLPADVDTLDLSDDARLAGQPCPALVQLGTARDALTGAPAGELLVDVEAVGLVAIDGPADEVERILLGIATSLAASPVGETLRLVTHGIDPAVHLGNLNAESATRLDEAIDCAVRTLGSTATATGPGRRRTFELRARGSGGEAWEPVVVVSAGVDELDDQARRELLELTHDGGRGLAVVIGVAVPGAGLTLQATTTGWLLERLGLIVVPVGLEPAQVQVVHDLLDAAERPLAHTTLELPRIVAADSTGDETGEAAGEQTPEGVLTGPDLEALLAAPSALRSFDEPEWALMVRLLGPVEVITPDGSPVGFERGKSLELLAWLSTHRDRPTRVAARTALWELEVRDATFANVVSDARRALARAVQPAGGEEWVVRTLGDALPLHGLVRSDADLLRCRVEAARHLPAAEAIDVLRPGVALVRGLPFEGAGYLWPDAEGTTSELVVLATGAATSLAQHALTEGDVDTVFWATGQGLRVLPGHEELVALRMKAYAVHGDLAGVRMEWELYERTLHSDPWSFGEPSPKLVAIRRQLLSN